MSSGLDEFLDPKQVHKTIALVAEFAKDQGVDIALAGGALMALYGSDRMTKDIDFVASLILDGFPDLGSLSFGGMKTETHEGVPVDLIVRDDDHAGLYEAALYHSVKASDSKIKTKILTMPYLMAMKLQAARDKDRADLRFLIIEAEDSDEDITDQAREVIKEFLGQFAVEEFERERDEALWLEAKELKAADRASAKVVKKKRPRGRK